MRLLIIQYNYLKINFRLFAAYEEETKSTTEIVQVLEYLSGGQLFEKIIESPFSKFRENFFPIFISHVTRDSYII